MTEQVLTPSTYNKSFGDSNIIVDPRNAHLLTMSKQIGKINATKADFYLAEMRQKLATAKTNKIEQTRAKMQGLQFTVSLTKAVAGL